MWLESPRLRALRVTHKSRTGCKMGYEYDQ
jgi:hypothetical protein